MSSAGGRRNTHPDDVPATDGRMEAAEANVKLDELFNGRSAAGEDTPAEAVDFPELYRGGS